MANKTRPPSGLAARFADGAKDTEIAAEFNVSRATVARWREALRDRIERISARLEAERIDRRIMIANKLDEAHLRILDDKGSDANAIGIASRELRALHNLGGSKIEVSGPKGGPIPLVVTDETIDRMLIEARKRSEKTDGSE